MAMSQLNCQNIINCQTQLHSCSDATADGNAAEHGHATDATLLNASPDRRRLMGSDHTCDPLFNPFQTHLLCPCPNQRPPVRPFVDESRDD